MNCSVLKRTRFNSPSKISFFAEKNFHQADHGRQTGDSFLISLASEIGALTGAVNRKRQLDVEG
jgi:hypothetical protein